MRNPLSKWRFSVSLRMMLLGVAVFAVLMAKWAAIRREHEERRKFVESCRLQGIEVHCEEYASSMEVLVYGDTIRSISSARIRETCPRSFWEQLSQVNHREIDYITFKGEVSPAELGALGQLFDRIDYLELNGELSLAQCQEIGSLPIRSLRLFDFISLNQSRAAAILNAPLELLWLNFGEIEAPAMTSICHKVSLNGLVIWGGEFPPNALATMNLPVLRSLWIELHADLNSSHLQALSGHPALEELVLDECPIDDEIEGLVASLPALTYLSVRNTKMSPLAVAGIRGRFTGLRVTY